METMISNVRSGKVSYFLVAIVAFVAAQSAQADEYVNLEGGTISSTSDWNQYEGKVVTNGTISLTGADGLSAGTYTIGDDAKVDCSGEFSLNGNYNLNIVGGEFNITGGTGSNTDPSFGLPLRNGQSTLLLDGGRLTSNSAHAKENRRAVNIGFIWNNKGESSNVDFSAKAVLINNSTLDCSRGGLRISGAKETGKKPKTSKTDFAVTNSTINLPSGQIEIGTDFNPTQWLSGDPADSYARVVFGPGSDITCKKIFAEKSITPEIKFDGATIHWVEGGNSFIGHSSALGDVYTIQSNGLTVDIPSGKALTCGEDASSLKGEGGITKIGEGSITWNHVSSGGSAGMTFTGPLVVSNGTWSSSLSYAATAFAVDGANSILALSGTLTAVVPDMSATRGGTLNLQSSTTNTFTLGTLTLGEDAVLCLTGGGLGVDVFSTDTLVLSATTANKVALNFTDAAYIPNGTYPIITITGGGTFAAGDEAKFALDADAPEGSVLSLSGDETVLSLTVPVLYPATWTGGAGDGKFSTPGNWLGGQVPADGSCVRIAVASEATLVCDIQGFAPASITFLPGSAAVTIDGTGAITGIAAVTNLSDSVQEIACPLTFADNYRVHCASETVNFSGGATATCPATDNTDNAASHTLMGEITFTNNWAQGKVAYPYTVPNGSVLHGEDARGTSAETTSGTNAKGDFLSIEEGGKAYFKTAFVDANNSHINTDGELYVEDVLEVGGSSQCHATHDQNDTGVIYADGLHKNVKNDVYIKVPTLYIGSKGLGSKVKDYTIHFADEAKTVYATADFEIFSPTNSNNRQDWGLNLEKQVTFNTQGHIINWTGGARGNGALVKDGEGTLIFNPPGTTLSGAVTVKGGTLKVVSASGVSGGATTVKNGATLEVASGATLGSSAVTLEAGSTLAFSAANNTFTALANAVTLPTGENEKATIRLDGQRLKSGNHTILSNVVGATDNVTLDMTGTALVGRKKASLAVEGTDLVLTIEPNAMIILIR